MGVPAIAVDALVKRHGGHPAVDGATFEVRGGTVTGFVGPNGAGKSTTLRLVAGLDRPTSGRILVQGRPLPSWREPGRRLGAALGGRCAHPGRTAFDSVRWVGHLAGVPARRCAQALEEVGLGAVARRPTRTFSLGMHQRLALAIALLADPEILVLDEPLNGLDRDGVAWFRGLVRDLRDQGRTVFFASHVLADVEDLLDDLVVIRAGRVAGAGPVEQWAGHRDRGTVTVRCDDLQRLAAVLQPRGGRVVRVDDRGRMRVSGLDAESIGRLAAAAAIPVIELATDRSLDQVFGGPDRGGPEPGHDLSRLLEGAAR